MNSAKFITFTNMPSRAEIESKLQQLKPVLSEKFHVTRIGYFGSYASETQRADSDLDLLVEFSQPIGWEFFTLEKYLEQSLGLRVDLVTHNALKERMKNIILKQVHYIEAQ